MMKFCPVCGSDAVASVNNMNAVWRALPVYRCSKCETRFSVRIHDTDIDIDEK